MISIPIQILYVHGHLRINYAIYGFVPSTSRFAKLLPANVFGHFPNVLAQLPKCLSLNNGLKNEVRDVSEITPYLRLGVGKGIICQCWSAGRPSSLESQSTLFFAIQNSIWAKEISLLLNEQNIKAP